MTEMSVLWDQLKVKGFCELADGTKLTSAQIRRMACEADIIPMVMDTNGVCLDMGDASASPPTTSASRSGHPRHLRGRGL